MLFQDFIKDFNLCSEVLSIRIFSVSISEVLKQIFCLLLTQTLTYIYNWNKIRNWTDYSSQNLRL